MASSERIDEVSLSVAGYPARGYLPRCGQRVRACELPDQSAAQWPMRLPAPKSANWRKRRRSSCLTDVDDVGAVDPVRTQRALGDCGVAALEPAALLASRNSGGPTNVRATT